MIAQSTAKTAFESSKALGMTRPDGRPRRSANVNFQPDRKLAVGAVDLKWRKGRFTRQFKADFGDVGKWFLPAGYRRNGRSFCCSLRSLVLVLSVEDAQRAGLDVYSKNAMKGPVGWAVETLNEAVLAEVTALPKDMRAKLEHIIHMIEAFGLERVREPYVKHLEGPLWEMRLIGRDGIARAVYVTAFEKRIVIIRAFRKKTQKTPRSEIKLALKRAKEVE